MANLKPKVKTTHDKCIDAIIEWAKKYEADNSYKYKKWSSDPKTHQCPICHPNSGKGWNCIGFVSAAYHHGGGVKSVRCSNSGLGNNAWFDTVTPDSRGIKKRKYSELSKYSKKFFRYTGKGKF